LYWIIHVYKGKFLEWFVAYSSDDTDVNVPIPPVNKTPPNPNLVFNEDASGPSGGQFVIDPKLVPTNICLGDTLSLGYKIKIPYSKNPPQPYVDAKAYHSGDIVTDSAGKTYLNLSWPGDPRGAAFTGSYKQSPTDSPSVWKEVTLNTSESSLTACKKAVKILNSESAAGGSSNDDGSGGSSSGGSSSGGSSSGGISKGTSSSKSGSGKYKCKCSVIPA